MIGDTNLGQDTSQVNQTSDPTENIPRDRWERILAVALHRRTMNPNDMEAHDAIGRASHALAFFDKDNPNVGGLLPNSKTAGTFAGTALEALGQIPSKTLGLGADLYEGISNDPMAPHVAGQLHTAATAIDPMTYVQPETRSALGAAQAEQPGVTLAGQITGNLLPVGPSLVRAGVGAMQAGGRGLLGIVRSLLTAGKAAAPEIAGEVAEAAPEASAALPRGTTAVTREAPQGLGVEGKAPPLRTVSKADEALSRATGGARQTTPQFEEGLPAARTSTLPKEPEGSIQSYLDQMAQRVGQPDASAYPKIPMAGLDESGLTAPALAALAASLAKSKGQMSPFSRVASDATRVQ